MTRVEKTVTDSFLKIVLYRTETFVDLNKSSPCYGYSKVDVISITPVGTDEEGTPLFCYELKYKEEEDD